jgi:hypothetical protein
MRIGVHGIDAPLVAGAVMRSLADAVDRRIAQVDVGRGHVDFRAQHVRALGERAIAHAAEQAQILIDVALAVGAVAAGFGKRAAPGAHLGGGLAVDVGVACFDQALCRAVHEIEIIAGVIEIGAPVEAQPLHRADDGIDVLLLFFFRVGVVEAQVAGAAVALRQPEVEADRLGVADVQIAVRLRREARADSCRIRRRARMCCGRTGLAAPGARRVPALRKVGLYCLADEIGRGRGVRRGFPVFCWGGIGHGRLFV